jgi:hypothetical protein
LFLNKIYVIINTDKKLKRKKIWERNFLKILKQKINLLKIKIIKILFQELKFHFKLSISKLIRKYIKEGPKGPFKINKLIKINFKIKREHLLPITISIL